MSFLFRILVFIDHVLHKVGTLFSADSRKRPHRSNVSGGMFSEIDRISHRLERGENLSQAEIMDAINRNVPPYTNTLNAAQILLRVAAVIAPYREDMTDLLLKEFLVPLFYTGLSSSEEVSRWLEYQLRINLAPDFLNNETGIQWIQGLVSQEERIQSILDEAGEDVEEYFIEDIEDWILPYSQVSAERVRVRWFWRPTQIKLVSPGILFFQTPYAGDSQTVTEIFRELTGILQKHDTEQALNLFFYNWESYEEVESLPAVEGENSDSSQRLKYPAHVVWCSDGKVIHNSFVSLEKIEILKQYTLDLLK